MNEKTEQSIYDGLEGASRAACNTAPTFTSEQAPDEQLDYDNEVKRLKIERWKQNLASGQQRLALQYRYANQLLEIAKCWLVFLISFLYAAGYYNISQERMFASDAVMVALLGATSVFGLLAIVLRHLFPPK